jgi:NADH-quinone oxidoreductase subunit G
MTAKAASPPGLAKDDWSIIRALSASVGKTLPYDDILALRAAMYKVAPQLARLGVVSPSSDGSRGFVSGGPTITAQPFANTIRDFYLTNPIARASAVMAEMSALKKNSFGTARDAAE